MIYHDGEYFAYVGSDEQFPSIKEAISAFERVSGILISGAEDLIVAWRVI